MRIAIVDDERPARSELRHQIAMAFAIAALSADGDTIIHDSQCVDVSYPEFFEILDGCR